MRSEAERASGNEVYHGGRIRYQSGAGNRCDGGLRRGTDSGAGRAGGRQAEAGNVFLFKKVDIISYQFFIKCCSIFLIFPQIMLLII